MAVFGYLGDDNERHPKPLNPPFPGANKEHRDVPADEDAPRPNPNISNGFSAALSCYPVARQLATQLDLNTLDSLSRTCRQFRANLLEYRDQLVKLSLRCENEDTPIAHQPYRLTTGKVSRCARDMVGECQRCATVVCRNCAIKPPPMPALRARHRRLCRTCSKAPLNLLTTLRRPRSASFGSYPHAEVDTGLPNKEEVDGPRAFTAPAFERTPCCCESVVWLCQPCGQSLKESDLAYVRAWSWRMRYTHYLGGVGTGAGEGNEGVVCGRGPDCLGAKIVEHETECDTEQLPALGTSPERWRGTSYFAQEIEGIGGGFKLKSKKQVRVGECVKVYKDEQDKSIQYLERENQGKLRSWCSWCDRVVPSKAELAGSVDTASDTGGSLESP